MKQSNPYTWHPANSRTGEVAAEGHQILESAAERAAELGLDAVAEAQEGILTGQGALLDQRRKRILEKRFGMFPQGQRIG